MHKCTLKTHRLQWDAPNSLPKLPLPFDDNHPHLIHPSSTDPTHYPKRHPDPLSHFATVHFPDRQTNRQTDRQTRWHDASRSLGNRRNFAYFPSGTESMGDRGSKKAYTGPRTGIYLPTKCGCDRSIVVGCRSRKGRQRDKQNGMTIRLTLCERDATDRPTDRWSA